MLRSRCARSSRRELIRPRLWALESREVPAFVAWDGGPTSTGTEWTDPANWSGDKLPLATDEVNIGAPFSGMAITHSGGTSTVQKLTSDAAITINGGTLVLANGTSTIDPGITVSPGGSLELRSATLNASVTNQGTLRALGTSNLGGPLTTVAGSVMRVEGSSAGHCSLTVANGFTNNGTINLTSTSGAYSSALAVTAGTLVNAADGAILIQPGTGGGRTLTAQWDNQGQLTIDQPLTVNKTSADYSNSGTIAVNANLTLTQSGTTPSFVQLGGTLDIAAGKSVAVSSGTFDLTGGALNGPGTFKLDNGVFTHPGTGTLGSLAAVTFNSSTVNFTPDFSTATTDLTLFGSTFNGPGQLINAKSLTLTASKINTTLINQGLLVAQANSSITTLSNVTGSTVRVEGSSSGHSTLTVANGITNDGTIELTSTSGAYSSTLVLGAGTLTNAPGGKILVQPGTGGSRALTVQLNNQGQVTIDQPLTIYQASADHVNGGSIAVNADLTLTQNGTTPSFAQAAGSLDIAAGKTLTVSGGGFDFNGGAINGPGSLKLSNGTFNHTGAGSLSALTLMSFTNATVNFTPDVTTTNTDLILSGSTFNGPGKLTNTKTLDLLSSTVNTTLINEGTLWARGTSIVDSLVTAAGSTVRVEGGNKGHCTLTSPNELLNNGTIELTSTSGTYAATLVVAAGALTNAPTGTIVAQPGTGGSRTLTAQLDNQGQITVNQPLTIYQAAADHVNSGDIQVNEDLILTQNGTTPSFLQAAGTIGIAAGKTIAIGGGTFDLIGGALTGPGSLKVTNATFNHPGSGILGSLASLSLTTSTANFTPNFSNATTELLMNGSTFNGPGTLTNVKALNLQSSTVNTELVNQGTLSAFGTNAVTSLSSAPGSTIHIEGSSAGHCTLTISNAFVNNGTIELTSSSGVYDATLAVTTGTLTNSLNSSILSQPGTGGMRTLATQLDNQGQVIADQALTINQSSADHVNSGLLRAAGGNITVTQSGNTPSFANIGKIQIDAGRDMTITGGNLANFAGSTLIGGNFVIAGKFQFPGANVVSNAAFITLDGPASAVLDSISGKDALAGLAHNMAAGNLAVLNGRALVTTAAFDNVGTVLIGAGSSLATGGPSYEQAGGVTTVNGTLDPAGILNVTGGTLGGNGVVQSNVNNSGGKLAPGSSTGQLVVAGDYTQSGTGRLILELNGPTAINEYDRLDVQGQVSLGGVLAATVGYKSVPGENFVILTNDGSDLSTGELSGIADNGTLIINGFPFRVNYNAGDGNDVVLTRLATGIDNIVVDDGSAQRSRVRSFTVTFQGLVSFPANPADAFIVQRTGPGGPLGTVTVVVDTSASTVDQTIAKLTFGGPLTEAGSLIDGRYTLSVLGSQLLDQGGQPIDADNNGTPGGTNLSNLLRLFGDADGDGDVDTSDFAAFRTEFGGSNSIFDFDDDGDVDAGDFGAFRQRFGASV